MPFHVTCVCGWQTVIGDDRAGDTLRCDACGRSVSIPRVGAPTPPPVPAPAGDPQPVAVVVDSESDTPPRALSSAAARRRDIQRLAVALSALAALSSLPLGLELWHGQRLPQLVAEPWVAAVVLLGLLQVAYAIYLVQLPDASALRVIAWFTLAAATGHAVVAGLTWWTPPAHPLMAWLALDRNLFSAQQESLWCLLLSILLGTMSYLAVRQARS